MPHFLIEKEEIKKDFIELQNIDNFFHIVKVLRCKIGEKIKFIDKDKNLYFCEIVEITKNNLKAKILNKEKTDRFLKNNICLIQSILAQDAQNLAIANAVQSGVKEIYPIISDNVSQNKIQDKKLDKWNKIALENFKQCERGDLPKINNIVSLKEAIKEFKKENVIIFAEKYADIKLDEAIKDIDKNDKIAVVIGPEGGFSENEFKYFKENNFKLVSLGKMIYKAPNAIVAGISNIVSRIEDVC